ncbi:MAG: rRNA pseudouridine synthase [Victivallaceae bacterium]|nr:rRNA pseudouridine synthase [Victivallaceae bacterium]
MNESSLPNLTAFLSHAGVASRRRCAELVKTGHVMISGKIVTDPSVRVQADADVTVDGRPVATCERKFYVMLNKPRGYVCTAADRFAKLKAVDLIKLPGNPRLFSAGRLDKDSEGLIIFSNDGDYVNELTHPSNEILKRYEVELSRRLDRKDLEQLRKGVVDSGERLVPRAVEEISGRTYLFVLNEGRKREIRRMASCVGASVVVLKRVAVGSLELGNLAPGKFRLLGEDEKKRSLDRENQEKSR